MNGQPGRAAGQRAARHPQAGSVAAIVGVNVARQLGDRRLVFTATVLPVVLILVTGLLAGGARVPLGVVNDGHGPSDARLLQVLGDSNGVKVHLERSPSSLEDDIVRGRVVAGLEIPADFGDGGHLAVTFVDQGAQTQGLEAHSAVVATVDVLGAEEQAAAGGGSATRAASLTAAALATVVATRPAPMSPFSYVGPADLVLFAGITLLVLSSGLVESRRLGLLRRMLAAPVRTRSVVLGQLATLLATAVGQAIGLLLIGRFIFGVHWGDPLGVALLVVCLASALSGISILLGTMARSQEQAVALGVALALAGGMLGGCIWPLSVVGPAMRAVGHLTPQAWAVDGFVALVYDHAGLGGVLPDAAVLAAFAVFWCSVAAWRLRVTLGAERSD